VPLRAVRGGDFQGKLPPALRAILVAGALTCTSVAAYAAEFGSSPYPKGFLDIFAGILPPEPGLYALNDVYFYDGSVGATIFNGAVQAGVDARLLDLNYIIRYFTKYGNGDRRRSP
jgi:hypothetical protein